MSTCGQPDGAAGAGPMRSAVPIADIFTGLYAAIAILAALIHRRDSGEGQYIDAALVDAATAINGHLALGYLMTGQVPQRQGNNNPITAPSEVFQATDGYFTMSAANAGQFDKLLRVLDLPLGLAQDPRFVTNIDRIANRNALHDILQTRIQQATVAHWIGHLSVAGVPCAPILNMQQLFEDPQVRHRGLALSVAHASGVDVPMLRSPLRLSAAPVEHRAPPMLGQHSVEVLQELLGKSPAELAQLKTAGVI